MAPRPRRGAKWLGLPVSPLSAPLVSTMHAISLVPKAPSFSSSTRFGDSHRAKLDQGLPPLLSTVIESRSWIDHQASSKPSPSRCKHRQSKSPHATGKPRFEMHLIRRESPPCGHRGLCSREGGGTPRAQIGPALAGTERHLRNGAGLGCEVGNLR